MKILRAITLVLVASVALPGCALGDQSTAPKKSSDPQDYGNLESHRSFAFHDPIDDREEPGLYILRVRTTSQTTRVLVRTPDDRHLVLTSDIDASTGRMTTEVVDDASGWWARTVTESRVIARNLFMFYRAYEEVHPIDGGTEIDVRFETSDGFSFATPIPAHDSISDQRNLAIEKLSATGRLAELSDSIPPELREAILFLDASLSPESWADDEGQGTAYGVRGALVMLAGALRFAPPDGQVPEVERWPMVVEPLQKGHGPWTPEELELFSGFRTVSPERFLPPERAERPACPATAAAKKPAPPVTELGRDGDSGH